jgi:uncharacterized protein YndB with AHSA1/START domain
MENQLGMRIDSVSRVIRASSTAIYEAWVNPEALASWLAPEDMTAEVQTFEPRVGGLYRMVLTYSGDGHTPGKATEHSDVVEGRFVELRPGERIVQLVNFESDDPAYAGTMKMTWTIAPSARGGSEVTITAENVPPGIRPEDHEAGMTSTLVNLAKHVE